MSDNATLVERLREREAYFKDGGPDHWPMAELLRRAAVRIAKLEAELDTEKRWRKVCLDGSAKRITELETERDRLKIERDEAKAFLRRMGPRGDMD